jgi:imidazolonepropionase-like amidohydrolase
MTCAVAAALALAPMFRTQTLKGGGAAGAARVYAIRDAKIVTLAGAPIEHGTVVIAAVGASVSVPSGAQVIEAKGLEVYPGLFDAESDLGLTEVEAVNSTVDTTEIGTYNPQIIAMTAVHPASELIPVARANGITHAIAAPSGGGGFRGGGEVIAGQASAINLAGWTIDEMLIRKSVAMVVDWPTLQTRTFDFATFSPRQRPFTEVKQEYDKHINELADLLDRARHYAQVMEKGSTENYDRDLKLEALVPVVEGKLPLLVVAEGKREIRSAVEFCTKQKVKMILGGGAESYKVKDLLAANHIPVILGRTEELPSDEDASYDQSYVTAGQLNSAGIKIAFASFNASFSRRLPYQAAKCVPYGLPYEDALKAVTLYPAQIFGLADELGSIEQGKMADLIVTDGDPLAIPTQVKYLFINGKLTSTDNRHLRLYEEYRKRYESSK